MTITIFFTKLFEQNNSFYANVIAVQIHVLMK